MYTMYRYIAITKDSVVLISNEFIAQSSTTILEYQFSGEHLFYQRVHDEIYRLPVEADLMVENENNTFTRTS